MSHRITQQLNRIKRHYLLMAMGSQHYTSFIRYLCFLLRYTDCKSYFDSLNHASSIKIDANDAYYFTHSIFLPFIQKRNSEIAVAPSITEEEIRFVLAEFLYAILFGKYDFSEQIITETLALALLGMDKCATDEDPENLTIIMEIMSNLPSILPHVSPLATKLIALQQRTASTLQHAPPTTTPRIGPQEHRGDIDHTIRNWREWTDRISTVIPVSRFLSFSWATWLSGKNLDALKTWGCDVGSANINGDPINTAFVQHAVNGLIERFPLMGVHYSRIELPPIDATLNSPRVRNLRSLSSLVKQGIAHENAGTASKDVFELGDVGFIFFSPAFIQHDYQPLLNISSRFGSHAHITHLPPWTQNLSMDVSMGCATLGDMIKGKTILKQWENKLLGGSGSEDEATAMTKRGLYLFTELGTEIKDGSYALQQEARVQAFNRTLYTILQNNPPQLELLLLTVMGNGLLHGLSYLVIGFLIRVLQIPDRMGSDGYTVDRTRILALLYKLNGHGAITLSPIELEMINFPLALSSVILKLSSNTKTYYLRRSLS